MVDFGFFLGGNIGERGEVVAGDLLLCELTNLLRTPKLLLEAMT